MSNERAYEPRKFQIMIREYVYKDTVEGKKDGKKYGKGMSKVLDHDDALKMLNVLAECKTYKAKHGKAKAKQRLNLDEEKGQE